MKPILIIVFLVHFPFLVYGQNFESGPKKVNTLELFSTQSCSSCPPAQKWVSSLKSHPKLWKTFIPIVYHVDYWDYLGWKDPFSKKEFSEMQRKYVAEWSGGPYTPMFVLNGKEYRPKNANALGDNRNIAGNLIAKKQLDGSYNLEFTPLGEAFATKIIMFHWALLGQNVSTNITAGENSGETLKHDFLVTQTQTVSGTKKGSKFLAKVRPNIKNTKGVSKHALVFWATGAGSLKPLQATGGPVN